MEIVTVYVKTAVDPTASDDDEGPPPKELKPLLLSQASAHAPPKSLSQWVGNLGRRRDGGDSPGGGSADEDEKRCITGRKARAHREPFLPEGFRVYETQDIITRLPAHLRLAKIMWKRIGRLVEPFRSLLGRE